jgi:hypothetical protein
MPAVVGVESVLFTSTTPALILERPISRVVFRDLPAYLPYSLT